MNKRIGSMILILIAVVTLSLHTPQATAKDYIPQAQSAGNVAISAASPYVAQGEIKFAEYVPPAPTPAPQQVSTTLVSAPIIGDKNSWLAASGIAESDWNYVDYIISHESGWNPNSTNSSSGAHGLPQALPYSKTGCGWTDAICQLQWANGYAVSKYGSWAGAYSFWQSHGYW